MSILSILLALIVIGVLFWGVQAIAAALSIPPPIITVIYVVLVILVVLYLVQALGGATRLPGLHL